MIVVIYFIIAIRLHKHLLLQLLKLMSTMRFIAINCMIDNKIISINTIITIMIKMHAGLFDIHVRLHAPDLVPETHS